MVLLSAISQESASEFCRQLAQDVFVRLFVDLALQDLLGAGDCDRGNLATQFFARAVGFLLDFGECGSNLAFALFSAIGLALGDDLVRPRMCLIENRRRLLARLFNDVVGFDLRLVETLLSALSGAPRSRS
jgi:hypothetical protein